MFLFSFRYLKKLRLAQVYTKHGYLNIAWMMRIATCIHAKGLHLHGFMLSLVPAKFRKVFRKTRALFQRLI